MTPHVLYGGFNTHFHKPNLLNNGIPNQDVLFFEYYIKYPVSWERTPGI